MDLLGLGYVGVSTDRLDDWRSYGRDILGLQPIDRTASLLAFRMDDRRQRIFVGEDGGAGCQCYGWELAGPDELDAAAGELEGRGIAVEAGNAALASERHVTALIRFRDPGGNAIELFHGPEIADSPFSPGRSISGFRTGPLGMGHVVLMAEDIDPLVDFYRDVLGFRLSDYALKPFRAIFMHVNPRHHSLAFVETGRTGTHHLMMELMNFDDVGQGYDLAQGLESNIGATLGRHTNDLMTSFYSWTPSKFMVEYGWGGREIDPATWKPYEMTDGPSLWGHDRTWMDEEGRRRARDLRLGAAAKGMREPVQVLSDNHHVMTGVCGWWDSMR